MNNTNYYIGTISEILQDEKEDRIVLVTIPGVISNVKAYPKSSELDEAKVGDPVLLLDLDPIFHSYFIYEKLKENRFIGFRASGKMVSITPENIKIAVYDEHADFRDSEEPSENHIKAQIIIDKDGNISIESSGEIGIYGKNNTDQTATVIFGNSLKPGRSEGNETSPILGGPFVTNVINGVPFYGRTITGIGSKND